MELPRVISNKLVIESSSNKIWVIDKEAGTTTLYVNQTQYDADNPVGTIQTQEIREVYEFVRNMDEQ